MPSSTSSAGVRSDSSDTVRTCFLGCSGVLRRRPGAAAALATQSPSPKAQHDELAEAVVERRDEDHDHEHEDQHHGGVGHQLLARGPHDLLQLRDHLAQEQRDAARTSRLRAGVERSLRSLSSRPAGSPVRVWVTSSGPVGRRRRARSGCSRAGAPDGRGRTGAVGVLRLPQGRRDSNPQPPVLETGALPIAPLPFGVWAASHEPPRAPRACRSMAAVNHRLRVYVPHGCIDARASSTGGPSLSDVAVEW